MRSTSSSAWSNSALISSRVYGRLVGRPSYSWTWGAVFQSKKTWAGWVPKYRSQIRSQPLLDRGELEIAGELLVAPALKHHLEHLLVRPKDRHRLHQLDRPEPSICIEYSRDPRYI
jgi:hypothetical protein